MSHHSFSHKTASIDSATKYDCVQPSELISNIKSMRNYQPIHLTKTQIIKSRYTGKLPNLSMLGSDSITIQTHPKVNNSYLLSLRKSCDDNCEVKLT